MSNPVDDEDLYDAITLGGVRSPGLVTLSGHDRNEKWDVKDGDGQGGATTTHKGEQVAQFTASFYLVRDPTQDIDEFAEWDAFAAIIESTVSGEVKALDIYHPDLARNRIGAVSKATIGGMKHDGKGGATIEVKFIEYRPPKKKGGNPKGAGGWTSSTSAAGKTDPNAAAKAELDKLTKQAQAA
jgi:hypothetical protein